MGKFSGILICSDVDGTFRCDEVTTKVNGEAVKYFIENGGMFSFATGRSVPHVQNSELRNYINAPTINLNGGVVYDYNADKLIWENRLDFTVGEFLESTEGYIKESTIMYIYNGINESDALVCTINDITDNIMKMNVIKMYIMFETKDEADAFKNFDMTNSCLKDCYISNSWERGLEIDGKNATKGNGLDYIRNYMENIHTTVGVGNYENDIPLITHADIGVAVGNATDDVKKCADLIVKPCSEFAIKDLIEILEKRVTK